MEKFLSKFVEILVLVFTSVFGVALWVWSVSVLVGLLAHLSRYAWSAFV